MAAITLFVLIVVTVTLALFTVTRNAVITVLLAALMSVAAFQMFAYANLGYLDPLFQIAAAVQAVIAVLISAGTAAIVRAKARF